VTVALAAPCFCLYKKNEVWEERVTNISGFNKLLGFQRNYVKYTESNVMLGLTGTMANKNKLQNSKTFLSAQACCRS